MTKIQQLRGEFKINKVWEQDRDWNNYFVQHGIGLPKWR